MNEKDPVTADGGHNVDGINWRLANDAARPSAARKTSGSVERMTVSGGEDAAGNTKETQCGLGSWRPVCLRPFGTIWSFTAAISMLWVIAGISFTYYSAVIPQIERRFGLSSSLSGFIRNVDNVGYMVVILAVSHLGRYANKPRILAASSLLSALSILVFAVPHFVYGGPGRRGHLPRSNESSAVWNTSTTAQRGRGRPYEVNSRHFLARYNRKLACQFLRATGTAIARLSHRNSVCLSVCHTGGSGKNGAS